MAQEQSQAPDRLAAWTLLYLACPLALFFGVWFQPWIAAALLCVLGLGLFHALVPIFKGQVNPDEQQPWPWLIGLVALCWCCMGGAGHLFFANPDWSIRDAVLRDLTVGDWPPSYGRVGEFDLILRAPVAFYLPAATLGKWLGVHWVDRLLLVWTVIGVGLFLRLLPLSRQALRWGLGLLCVVLFSGMDIVGGLLFFGAFPPAGTHIEWWASAFQYSSNTTQLFWVPNHALPAWLAMALFFRHWRHPGFLRLAPLLFAVLPLWSPFAAIGMSPFYLLLLVPAWKAWQQFLHPFNWVPALLILLVTGLYLTLDLASVPAQSQISGHGLPMDFLVVYAVFCTLEFGLLGIALYRYAKGPMWIVAMLTLAILPFFRMGPGNDIVMRGGIPALMFLCLAFLSSLRDAQLRLQDLAGTAVLLVIGAVTPLEEIDRALTLPAWSFREDQNLAQAAGGTPPPHYAARLNQAQLMRTMRSPQPVSPIINP